MINKTFVFDANIWFGYIISDGFNYITTLIRKNNLVVYGCDKLIEELQDNLSKPKVAKKIKTQLQIDDILRVVKELTVDFEITPSFKDCKDKDDNFLFDLAIQSKSDFLVSKDKIVLATKINPPPQIISYTEFREMFL